MKFEINSNSQIANLFKSWAVYTIIIALIFYLIAPKLNTWLKTKNGRFFSDWICKSVFVSENKNIQWGLSDICESVNDYSLTEEEIGALINQINMIFSKKPNLYSQGATQSDSYRETRVRNVVGYGVREYINRIKVNRYVDLNKPTTYFQDVYSPNRYNEEQKILLEQAKYVEYNSDGSYAQSVLGPKRELIFVGLKFPYGSAIDE